MHYSLWLQERVRSQDDIGPRLSKLEAKSNGSVSVSAETTMQSHMFPKVELCNLSAVDTLGGDGFTLFFVPGVNI